MDEHTIKQKFLHIFTEIWLPPVIVAAGYSGHFWPVPRWPV